MAAAPPAPAGLREQTAKTVFMLDHAARGTALFLLPLLMAIAAKSSVLVASVAALFCIASAALRQGSLGAAIRSLLPERSVALSLALCFIAYATASIIWSVDRAHTVHGLGEIAIVLAASWVLGVALRRFRDDRITRYICWSIILCSVVILFEVHFDMPLRRLAGSRPETPQFKRAVEALTMMAAPVLMAAFQRRPDAIAWAAAIILAIVAYVVDSGASLLALIIALASLAIARFSVDALRRLGLIVTLALLATAPLVGDFFDVAIPKIGNAALIRRHIDARIPIWRAHGWLVTQHPVLGLGFDAATDESTPPLLKTGPADLREVIPAHSHHFFLQIWVELGVIGALLCGALIWSAFQRIARAPPDRQTALLIFFLSAQAIALVAHSSWQGAWLAAAGASLALINVAYPARPDADARA